ncbi:MAG: DNA mismatch repair protein MutS [Promethearchaeota archaeon]|nr:MAG: DNA mismatch repair protein MutS [Candidatus Lokiarchaeota archaeon]
MKELNIKDLTPMMKHWFSVKERYKNKYPEHLIAYRMGDFYEFFYDDAIRVSNLLGITLTKRRVGGDAYPLAGIPHHAGSYLKNLVNLGQTVVVVDQLEDPSTVKGRIVKRGVVRILSPGTIIETDMLKSNENNYICSIVKEKRGFGIAFADLSTGEFVTTEYLTKDQNALDKVLTIFSQYDPVEVIVPLELKNDDRFFLLLTDLNDALIKPYEDYVFAYNEAHELIKRHFNLSSLDGLGLDENVFAIQASGGLLAFLKETQRDILPNIFKISLIQEKGLLHLDYITQRNLELTTSLWERGKDTTLFSVFNHTHTPMGTRLLKKVILQPLIDIDRINQRLNIVQKFKDDIFLRTELSDQLNLMGDLERYINRINYSGNSNARDLINIKNSLDIIPKIKQLLEKASIPEIDKFLVSINDFTEIKILIETAIKEDPPTTVKEGNIIKDGFNKKVDELRDIRNNGKRYLLNYEKQEKQRLNLTSGLKIGHNNILGYYIQITLNTLRNIAKVPEEYNERQTLKNAKRYTTTKLKTLEEGIVEAEEQIFDLEYEIYCTIRERVIKDTKGILETTKSIAYIDVFACFAQISENYNYCRPVIDNNHQIVIKEGRHPVVEQMNITDKFIPNDCYLDTEGQQILIITGPNMSGKSTYLRQVALICIIAQMGCFVPAKSAEIGVIDQIFTRIGASDDLARKLSTFMIEMTETAKILNYATPSSLVIIDELGRGTSTSDGQSIAMATIEKLHELKAKTLFSTHYHQLTEINLPRIKNFHLDIIENDDGSINFVRTLKEGSTDKSYGIHVAKLAGIPEDVIIRAFEILDQIEHKDPFKEAIKSNNNGELNGKYYDKFIKEKQKELQKINSELTSKQNELVDCEDKLSKKEKELVKREFELEKFQTLIKQKSLPNASKGKKSVSSKKEKNYVQTTFFKPEVMEKIILDDDFEEILKIIKNLDINSLTPIEAMKVIIDIKQKADLLELSTSKDVGETNE